MFSQIVTIIAIAATLASATPITKRIAPDTQSCKAKMTGAGTSFDVVQYGVNIGVPYNGGVGCNDVFAAIQDKSAAPSNWQCQDDGSGNTQLYFNAISNCGSCINEALTKMYPTVNSFNCPDH